MSADPQPTAGAVSGAAHADDAVRETSAFQRAILECADYSIISTGSDGTIRTFNRAAERMLGYRAEEVIGKVSPEIIHDLDEVTRRAANLTAELGRPVAAGFEALVAKARLGLADEQEWTYIRKDGGRVPVQLSVTAMRDEAGQIIGFLGIAHDITRRRTAQARVGQLTAQLDRRVRASTGEFKTAQRELAAGGERFRLVVEASPSGIIMVDRDGRIVLVNAQTERLFGYAREELLGQPVDLLVPDRAREGHAGQRAAFFAAPGTRPMGAGRDLFARRKDGSEFPVEIGLNPIQTEEGLMVLGAILDITQRKQAEQELRASEERLKLAQQAARVGTFELNLRTGVNIWSPELEAMHGLPPGGFAGTQPAWESLLHPEDRAEALACVQRAFQTNVPAEGEWRVLWPDGSTHWLFGRFQVFRDASGQPLRLTGVNLEITERKRAERITATLAELGRELGAVSSRRAAAEVILAAVDRLFPFDALLLHMLAEDRRRVFRILMVDTVDGKRVEQPAEDIALEPSAMYQRVTRQGGLLVLRESPAPVDVPLEPFGDQGRASASLMFVPIRAGGRVIGVLSVQSYAPRAYDGGSLELLQSLADYAGTGLARVGAHVESERLSRLLLETQRVARLGCFEGNLLTGSDHWSDEAYRQMGYAPGEVAASLANFLARVHPDDRARVARDIEQITRDGQAHESGYRLVTPDGKVRQIHSAVAAEVNAAGRVVRVFGAAQDVTHQRQIEAELRQSQAELEHRVEERTAELGRMNVLLFSEVEERKVMEAELRQREEQLRDLFENATDLIQSVAPDGHLLFVNRAWLNTLGYRMADLAALTIFDIIHPDCLAECREQFLRVLRGEPVTGMQAVFRAQDGRKIHVEGSASCRFEDGKPVATRAIFRDISKRKAVEEERERLIKELQAALAEVKTLSGLLPVCGWCKKIRDDSGYWDSVEGYLKKNSGVDITHGICPECSAKMMGELDQMTAAPSSAPSAP